MNFLVNHFHYSNLFWIFLIPKKNMNLYMLGFEKLIEISFFNIYCKFIMVRSSLPCSQKHLWVNIVTILLIVFILFILFESLPRSQGKCFSILKRISFLWSRDCNLIITQHIQLPVLMQFRIITYRNMFCFLSKSKAAAEQFNWEDCPLRK